MTGTPPTATPPTGPTDQTAPAEQQTESTEPTAPPDEAKSIDQAAPSDQLERPTPRVMARKRERGRQAARATQIGMRRHATRGRRTTQIPEQGASAPDAVVESSIDPHKQQKLYWEHLVELKVHSIYYRLYRNRLSRINTSINAIKAFASSGSISVWVIWQRFAIAWAFVIVVSQLIDWLKDFLPFAKHLKAAADLTNSLERLYFDAELEWYRVYTGRLDANQIAEACRRLQITKHEAGIKSFPNGNDPNGRLLARANAEATTYLRKLSDSED